MKLVARHRVAFAGALIAVTLTAAAACRSPETLQSPAASTPVRERQLTDWPGTENNARFSPDGDRIAFDAVVQGQSDLYVMRLEDGAVTRLTNTPAADRRPAWSADGRSLVFQSDRHGYTGIWWMDAAGGEAVAVFGDPTHAAIGPDLSRQGRLVATVLEPDPSRDYGHVTPWVMNADGSDAHPVTTGGDEWWARWGADGKWLYYYSGSVDDLYAVHADSGQIRNISLGGHVGWRPVPSPDGSSLAFVSAPGWSVWVRPLANRPELVRLTQGGREDFPEFSPDGRSVVFSSDRSRSAIVSLDPATGGRRILVEGAAPGPLEADGSFAFVQEDGDPLRAMFFDAATATATPLPVSLQGIDSIAVASDDGPIAVSANGGGPHRRWNIHLVARDGTASREITSVNSADNPAWCGGQEAIYYSANDEQTNFSQIYRFDLASGTSTQITHEPYGKQISDCSVDGSRMTARMVAGRTGVVVIERAQTGVWSERMLIDAREGSFSPDGKRLAFVRSERGRTDLFLQEADGSMLRLTDDDLIESSPHWSHDGTRVIFAARADGRDLWLLPLPQLPWNSVPGGSS